MNMREYGLKEALNTALQESLAWKGYKKYPKSMNSNRSAYFCHQVGLQLNEVFERRFPEQPLTRRQIKFDHNDNKKAGEWLLDIVWCEKIQPDPMSKSRHPSKIYGAVECESNTSAKEFFKDFSKLVHVRSKIKLYLAGVNHTTKEGMKNYIRIRKDQTTQFLNDTGVSSELDEWYLAFWPSPMYNRDDSRDDDRYSLWDKLDIYPHLNKIRVFSQGQCGQFVSV